MPELGGSPDTELWAVVYDIEDNNQIDFGGFSFFAAAFGQTVKDDASQPPYVGWADFDKSGRVDFGDLAFFAPNFGKNRQDVQSGAQTLVFPPNFPDAWRPQSGQGDGGGVGETQDSGEGEASSRAWMLAEFDGPHRSSPSPLVHREGSDQTSGVHLQRQDPGTPETAPWLTSGGRKAPSGEPLAWHARRRLADSGREVFRFDRWEPLEDVLTLLAERSSNGLPDDALAPHDALFTQFGR